MLVVTDTFDYEDFPVFVGKDENVHEVYREHSDSNKMSKVMEVYNLSMDLDEQLSAGRAFNF